MLIPAAEDTPERQEHWQKSYALIEETVFQQEDIATAESIQAGLRSGANETLALGRFEGMIKQFHDDIEAAIAAPGALLEEALLDAPGPPRRRSG
jgi:hypothetical protein